MLDFRHGFDNVILAETEGDKIIETHGSTIQLGKKILQNVLVESPGGQVKRVVDINDKSILYFTLPKNLNEISYQNNLSVFAGSHISEIKFSDNRVIDGKPFISATFLCFTGKEYPIILDMETGNPLHIPGIGHRNEIATTWIDYTIRHSFYLGANRMIGVRTISEDLKENEILFSVQQLTSWLPFYDNYLPIFKQIVEVENNLKEEWAYRLLELAVVSKDKEYIVVEKNPPYRILVNKKSGGYKPKIIKSKNKTIKSPEDFNALIKFFYLDSGMLADVE